MIGFDAIDIKLHLILERVCFLVYIHIHVGTSTL